nr:PaaI family thioesterase [Paenisporosarcina sp. TG-14]
MQPIIQDIRESFEKSRFFSYIGYEIIEFQENMVLLKLPINEEFLNVNNTLHGGVHAAMLDQVLGMVTRVTSKTRCATINLNINYLAPSMSGSIYAKANIVQHGYRIATAEGEIYDEQGKTLAKGIGTFKLFRD